MHSNNLLASCMPCSSSLQFQYFVVLIAFCNLRNHWFIYCIILLCVCIAYYFQYLSWPEVVSESHDVLSINLEALILIVYLLEQWLRSIQGTVTSLEPLSIKISWKTLDLFLLNVQSICKQTSMPVLKNYVIKSLTFLRLPERHQVTLDELYVLMQRFPRVILFCV